MDNSGVGDRVLTERTDLLFNYCTFQQDLNVDIFNKYSECFSFCPVRSSLAEGLAIIPYYTNTIKPPRQLTNFHACCRSKIQSYLVLVAALKISSGVESNSCLKLRDLLNDFLSFNYLSRASALFGKAIMPYDTIPFPLYLEFDLLSLWPGCHNSPRLSSYIN